MPEKKVTVKRPAPISYRPPKGLTADFHAHVSASGLSANAFITACIFGRSRLRPADLQMLARLLDQTARIADQLQALSVATAEDHARALAAAQQELGELRAALLGGMERSP